MLHERGISAVIVEDDHLRPAAIFTERDFTEAAAKYGAAALSMPVGPLASAPLVTCRPDDRIDAALSAMSLAHVRHLPVMSDGTLHGMISMVDLVRQRLKDKEFEAQVLLDLARRHA
jgi:CBS domain-containing protein